MNSDSLTSKVAVVTGASSGLGNEVVKLLVEENVTVIALARSIKDTDLPAEVLKLQVDLTDKKSVKMVAEEIDAKVERIDFLVNCAGRGLVKSLEGTTAEEIDDVIGINLVGTIYLTQEIYKKMISHKSGHIINVSSTSGIKARIDEPIYCASKWGLRGFTESLRMAAATHKIRVTGVYPGGMKTNFWKGGEPRDTSQFMDPKDVAKEIIKILKSPNTIAPSEYIIERGF